MQVKFVLGALALVATTALATSMIHSGPTSLQDAPPKQDAQEVDMAKMMQAFAKQQELAKPGKIHEHMAKIAGEWDLAIKMASMPGMPSKAKGKATCEMLLGGRFVMQRTSFKMMGMTVEGVLILGYDNLSEEYVALWMDSMGTGMSSSSGKADPEGMIELKGLMKDAVTPEGRPYRSTTEIKSDDEIRFILYDTMPGMDSEFVVMDITYTRREK